MKSMLEMEIENIVLKGRMIIFNNIKSEKNFLQKLKQFQVWDRNNGRFIMKNFDSSVLADYDNLSTGFLQFEKIYTKIEKFKLEINQKIEFLKRLCPVKIREKKIPIYYRIKSNLIKTLGMVALFITFASALFGALNDGLGVFSYFGNVFNSVEPFRESNDLKVLVFPFENYSTKTETNLSKAIFNKLEIIKRQDTLNNLKIKWYNKSIKGKSEYKIVKIAKELNADFYLWGSYEIGNGCENSLCLQNMEFKQVNSYSDTRREKIEFKGILNGIESGKLTQSVEFYIYYVLAFFEFENLGNPRKGLKLFNKCKRAANNQEVKMAIQKLTGRVILNDIYNPCYHVFGEYKDIRPKNEQDDYGWSPDNPIITSGFNPTYYFLRGLQNENGYVYYERTTSYDFKVEDKEVKGDKYLLADRKFNTDIGYLYICMCGKNDYFFEPKGLRFKARPILPESILDDFKK